MRYHKCLITAVMSLIILFSCSDAMADFQPHGKIHASDGVDSIPLTDVNLQRSGLYPWQDKEYLDLLKTPAPTLTPTQTPTITPIPTQTPTATPTPTQIAHTDLRDMPSSSVSDHDGRYYTETESGTNFVDVDGDTMTGNLSFDDGVGISPLVEWKDGSNEVFYLLKLDGGEAKFYCDRGFIFHPNEYENTSFSISHSGSDFILGTLDEGQNIKLDPDGGTVTVDEDLYIVDNCSALSFTDRSSYFEGKAIDAIRAIKPIAGSISKDGFKELDKKTMPKGTVITRTLTTASGTVGIRERDIGKMISVLVKANQELEARVSALEKAK